MKKMNRISSGIIFAMMLLMTGDVLAELVSVSFSWTGDDGYSMEGSMDYEAGTGAIQVLNGGFVEAGGIKNMSVSFYDPSANLLGEYDEIVNGIIVDNYLTFTYDKQSLSFSGDVSFGPSAYYIFGPIGGYVVLQGPGGSTLDETTDTEIPAEIAVEEIIDIDEDGMSDEWEDANGLNSGVNDAALDPDNDGLTNLEEYNAGTNPQSADTDGDGIPDQWEVDNGTDPSVDDAAQDPDNDQLLNIQEYSLSSNSLWQTEYTNVTGAVSNFNFGVPGSTDPMSSDSDSDGVSDFYEITTNAAITNLYITHPNNADTDGDGMPDGWEIEKGLDPLADDDATGDPDQDQLLNIQEYSLRSSSLWQAEYTNVPGSVAMFSFGIPGSTDPMNSDSDGDNVSDFYEITTNAAITNLYITNPNSADTDGDGFADGAEITLQTDPLSNQSYFQIAQGQSLDGDMSIVWPSVSGCSYTVQFAESLLGEWNDIGSWVDVPGTGELMLFEDPQTELIRFYRVRIQLP